MKKFKTFIVLLSLVSVSAIYGDTVNNVAAPVEIDMWNKIGFALTLFLIISVVFETAMTPIFNWRIFVRHFHGKGVKTPLMVGLAFLFFWGYDLDLIHDILVAVNHPKTTFIGGKIISALLIAGGSNGVFKIFTKLGIRNPADMKDKAEEEIMKKNKSTEK